MRKKRETGEKGEPSSRVRIRLACPTGIPSVQEFFQDLARVPGSLRQEVCRRCLIVGMMEPERTVPEREIEVSRPGTIERLRIDIHRNDPDLSSFIEHYHARGDWDNFWALKILLAGAARLKKKDRSDSEALSPGEGKTPDPDDLGRRMIGGLFQ